MPTIIVDDQNHYLHYEDTGVPGSSSKTPYTTFIVVHGTSFHSGESNAYPRLYRDRRSTSITIGVFKRLLPLAPQHNIRLVLLNRRDYPGSSPYTEEELDGVKAGSEAAQTAFGIARAMEFATFIQKFVAQNDVPRMTKYGKDGGVVMMSWSSGTMYALPLLAYADAIPDTIREALEPHFRRYIIFGKTD